MNLVFYFLYSEIPKLDIVRSRIISLQGIRLSNWNVSDVFERKSIIVALIISCFFVITFPNAYAAHVVWVGDPFSLNVGTADPVGLGSPRVIVRVTDAAANTNPVVRDTIQVLVTSSVNPAGITLTLQETAVNNGIFENNDLALMSGTDVFLLSNTATITVYDNIAPNPAVIQTINNDDSIIVLSESDTFGITPIFTETSATSNTYTATISFGASSNDPTNVLAAVAGDFITVDDTTGGNRANGMISPNPFAADFRGAIEAVVGQAVTVAYQGHQDSFNVAAYPGGGREGGGAAVPSLVVDAVASTASSTGGGDGCIGDCTPPTLGVDEANRRIVDGGFSYNDHPVDVQLYYTPYPLVTVNVGQENKAVLKIYDNSGPQHIQHVELAFGLGNNQILDDSKAVIAIDMSRDGKNTVSTYDPENALQDIRVETDLAKCGPFITAECLIVTIYHTFRAPLDFNMVATDVWDFDKSEWQNYFNDGIEVIGESLNPPREHIGIYKGQQVRIVETDKYTAIDADGNKWTFDREWIRDYVPPSRVDTITSHRYDRNDADFPKYKKEQEQLATVVLNKMLGGKEIHEGPEPSYTIRYDYVSRGEDKKLHATMISEMLKAEKIFAKIVQNRFE
ncbi:MAG: hypothetical protein WAO91_07875 [Candidatus Nitrosotenuis sp.]